MSHARIFGKLPLLPVLLLSVLILTLTLAGLLAVGGIAQGAHPAARSGSPGTITVTKTGDTGGTCTATDCSLREAIKGAVSGDTVQVPAGTYTLTALFELTINKSLTLTGAGSGDTIIQAATGEGVADFRVFMITGDSTAAISRVTIRHGNSASSGGGIYNNSGTLTLTNSTLSGNSGGYGGGIYNGGTLTMTSSTVSNNNGPISISNKGAMTVTSSTVSNNSGGIFNTGILAVGNSTVSNNTGGGDGAGIRNDRGSVNLTDSKIINNTAHWDGGGIRNSGTLTVTNSAH